MVDSDSICITYWPGNRRRIPGCRWSRPGSRSPRATWRLSMAAPWVSRVRRRHRGGRWRGGRRLPTTAGPRRAFRSRSRRPHQKMNSTSKEGRRKLQTKKKKNVSISRQSTDFGPRNLLKREKSTVRNLRRFSGSVSMWTEWTSTNFPWSSLWLNFFRPSYAEKNNLTSPSTDFGKWSEWENKFLFSCLLKFKPRWSEGLNCFFFFFFVSLSRLRWIEAAIAQKPNRQSKGSDSWLQASRWRRHEEKRANR